jgi:hypothetical protein
MRSIIKLLLIILTISFISTGCYTVVWDPAQDLPNDQTYSDSDEFYINDYYGGYTSYYETPWWIAIPPTVAVPDYGQDNNAITKDRNSSNGRNSEIESSRNSGGRANTDNTGRTYLPPPTISTGSGSSGTVTKSPTTTRDSSSRDNSSSKESNNTNTTSTTNSSNQPSNNNGRSSGTSNTRNDSGSRNSSSSRR